MMATRDTNRPTPQNNAIVTNGLSSGFLDEADGVTTGEPRTIFGISSSPNISGGQNSMPSAVSAQRQRRFSALFAASDKSEGRTSSLARGRQATSACVLS